MKNVLIEKWNRIKRENPQIRIREAARQLDVSEAELVATGTGSGNTLLNNDFKSLLKEVEKIGQVMALTRNDYCVHERKGVYNKVAFNGEVGLAVNPDIDLRLFMSNWKFGFAVNENGRLSFQFFDKSGEAVHKIYLTESSDKEVYEGLKEKYKAANQDLPVDVEAWDDRQEEKQDSDIDSTHFGEAWKALQDTHHFHGMLKSFGVSRLQAMRLAPAGFTEPLDTGILKRVLESVAAQDVEIMVFTGSRGCIQIHTGLVKNLVQTGPWFNVLDPQFNMHLREDGIAAVWLVKKPTKDGIVTSIEVFDNDGGIIVQFFGKRKPGIPESEAWRSAINQNLAIPQ